MPFRQVAAATADRCLQLLPAPVLQHATQKAAIFLAAAAADRRLQLLPGPAPST
jgi:hypothetical protein